MHFAVVQTLKIVEIPHGTLQWDHESVHKEHQVDAKSNEQV